MTVFRLSRAVVFPDPALADEDGLLAVGGDLSSRRLIAAYAMGIFPWYSEGEPILWWSPDPRTILEPASIHVSRSLAKTLRRGTLTVTADAAFEHVIDRCASKRRAGQRGTWITRGMRDAYVRLHAAGLAHSVEAWREGEVVGGLYGVSLGGAFFGESMYADAPDASKAAFVRLCETLRAWEFPLVDCQMKTSHLSRFGAFEIPRDAFLARLRDALRLPTRQGRWRLEPTAGIEPATC